LANDENRADARERELEEKLESLRQNADSPETGAARDETRDDEDGTPDGAEADAKESDEGATAKAGPAPEPDASSQTAQADEAKKETESGKAEGAPELPKGLSWKEHRNVTRELAKRERELRALEDKLQAAQDREERINLQAKANGYELDDSEGEPTDADLKAAVEELGPKLGAAFHKSQVDSYRAKQKLREYEARQQGKADDPFAEAIEKNDTVYDWLLKARSGDASTWDRVERIHSSLTEQFKTPDERITRIQELVEQEIANEAAAKAKPRAPDGATPSRSLENAPGTAGDGDEIDRFRSMNRKQRREFTDRLQDEGEFERLDRIMKGLAERTAA